MPVGTNGNDFLFFEGTLGTLLLTITNPYTGEIITLNDTYNVNNTTYDGLNGNDTLLMTDFGDALFLEGTGGIQTVKNVETFLAGNGGDAIVLSSATFTLGNITIDGGLGNDVLWGNNGNDRITGNGGNDNINGGGGNDLMFGQDDDDTLSGALGADSLVGDNGNDVLNFWGDAAWTNSFGLSVNGGIAAVGSGLLDVVLDASYLRSFDTFNGGADYDFLNGTSGNDVIVLQDNLSSRHSSTSGARIVGVEEINAGAGNDFIDLKSALYTYGDVVLHGGLGADWIRSGAGNDHLHGDGGADVLYGMDGDDTLHFSADTFSSGTVDLATVAPGLTGLVDLSALNMTLDYFDGGNGLDVLQMTSGDDFLSSQATVMTSIEEVDAGAGNDFLYMTSVLSTVTVFGGDGHDTIILSSVDNTAYGDGGNDILAGLEGNDTLFGGDGHDTMLGGFGDDVLEGGDGNDVLYGGNHDDLIIIDKDFDDAVAFPHLIEGTNIVNLVPPGDPSLGVVAGNLDIGFDASATITFRKGYAGYNNTLGVYAVADDGTIMDASILWKNVKTAGINVEHTVNLPTDIDGAQLGFFIIADGNTKNAGYSGLNVAGEGNIKFIFDYGLVTERAAKVTDLGTRISVVYDDGVTEKLLKGYAYHTTERGESAALNWDNKTHIVSGLAATGNDDIFRIGFEDLPGTGDADYEDVLFDFNINGSTTDPSEVGNDVLIGGLGDDTLYGEAGNDLLEIGLGLDHAYGGSGSDTFKYDGMDTLVDIIFDFEVGAGKDNINLSELLSGFDSGDNVNNFIQLATVNGDTALRVNQDGDVGGAFTTIALIDGGVGGATLNDLINQGNLVLNP